MSIFSDLKVRGSAPRNGFDRSSREVFSTKVGPIKTIRAIDTLPNSHYEIDINQLLRSQPLATAAFTGFSINYDVQFVPNEQLLHGFNRFIAQRGSLNSSADDVVTELPYFYPVSTGIQIAFVAGWEFYCLSLARAAGYRSYSEWMLGAYRDFAGVDCYLSSPCAPGTSLAVGAILQMDTLGYGNFLPFAKAFAAGFEALNFKDALGDVVWQEFNYDFSTCPLNAVTILFSRYFTQDYIPESDVPLDVAFAGLDAWLNQHGYYPHTAVADETGAANMLRVLAYNKSYYDFYRSEYYSSQLSVTVCNLAANHTGNPTTYKFDWVHFYNFDKFNAEGTYQLGNTNFYVTSCSIYPGNTGNLNYVIALLSLKHHLYKRDLFTGVLPDTQFGDVSMASSSSDVLYKILSDQVSDGSRLALGLRSGSANAQSRTISNSDTISSPGNSVSWSFDPAVAISVLELRRADAMQRFNERMLRAGDDVKSIFEAHGWKRPKSQLHEQALFLGSFDGNFDINVVAATTWNENQSLGQLGANGVATVQGSKIYFDCSDFGTILVNLYITKMAEYDSFGIDPTVMQIEPFDFPYPELQNISLAPVDSKMLLSYGDVSSRILGYLPRAYGYKTSVDHVHDEFFTVTPNSVQPQFSLPSGIFSNFVTPKSDLQYADFESFLYIDSRCVDNVFYVGSSIEPQSNQFLVNFYLDVKAVQPLPVIGLPI